MTIKPVASGSGYRYLTDQVAHHDDSRVTDGPEGRKGPSEALDDYYSRSGNLPGQWMGAGAKEIGVAGEVTETQMANLFAKARHPNYEALQRSLFNEALVARDSPEPLTAQVRREILAVVDQQLLFGAPFRKYRTVEERVADRIGKRAQRGQSTTVFERNAIEKEEIEAGTRQSVAGFDLTFTPVKSVSVLWALGDADLQAKVLAAHRAAVADAIGWIEREVASARSGRNGIAHHSVEGLIVAAFEHRTSRTLQPTLHTHAEISAKVRTTGAEAGKWLALDGTALFKAVVAASEYYNSRIEDEIRTRTGARFTVREGTGVDGKEAIREVEGIPLELIAVFSDRRAQIERVYEAMLAQYRRDHGYYPTRKTQYKLAERACLATRPRKERGSTAVDERADWHLVASGILGYDPAVLMSAVTGHTTLGTQVNTAQISDLAAIVLAKVVDRRAMWTERHVQAEAQRVTRDLHLPSPPDRERLVAAVTAATVEASVMLTPKEVVAPATDLMRADERSVLRPPAFEKYTSTAILTAESELLAAASRRGPTVGVGAVEEAIATADVPLAKDQAAAVRSLAVDGQRLSALIGPAGSGKTTTLHTLAKAWSARGHDVLGLAVGANAAAILGDSLGAHPAENIAKWLYESEGPGHERRQKWLHELRRRQRTARTAPLHKRWGAAADKVEREGHQWKMRRGQLVTIDEAGMVPTLTLQKLLHQAERAGAKILLVGDWRQLSAIQAGGALRLIDTADKATHLTSVWRFKNEWEGKASLRIRRGDAKVAAVYKKHGRIVEGSHEELREAMYTAWQRDESGGRVSLMMTVGVEEAAELAGRARRALVAVGTVHEAGILLADGNRAGVGDRIVTRNNDRTITLGRGDYVRNGYQWTVLARNEDDSLRVKHVGYGHTVTLPAAYVAEHVGLGYATTITRAQGMTVDTGHALITEDMSREQAYPALTRGRWSNHAYTVTRHFLDIDGHGPHAEPNLGIKVLARVIRSETADLSATETAIAEQRRVVSVHALIERFIYARDLHAEQVDAATPAGEARRAAYPEILRRALGPTGADKVLSSPAYPALVTVLRSAELQGVDIEALLPNIVTSRELATARDLAKVLRWRVLRKTPQASAPSQPAPAAAPSGLPDWLTLRQFGDPDDGNLGTYGAKILAALGARITGFQDAAAANPARWEGVLGDLPADPARRARWRDLAGQVATYRDLYNVTGGSALGDEPTDKEQKAIYTVVRDRLRTWHTPATTPGFAEQVNTVTRTVTTRMDAYNRRATIAPPRAAVAVEDPDLDDTPDDDIDADTVDLDVD